MKVYSAFPNCIVVHNEGKRTLFSYGSPIAQQEDNRVILDARYWDYSKTTGKHRNWFLGENVADTRKKIKSGIYTVVPEIN